MTNQVYFLGRQPILNRDQELVAYELLFRSGEVNQAFIKDDLIASATVINHAFMEFGIDGALGLHKGFINASESLLMSDIVEFLPKEKVVLEILESVQITPGLVERCQQLKKDGFSLALDDCIHITPEIESILDVVSIIKIDISPLDIESLSTLVGKLQGKGIQLLAEKVDNIEQFNACKELGFDLFQGYYFAKPQIISGKKISPSELGLLKLLGQILTDEDDSAIENTLKQNPGISFNLLRIVNSAAFDNQNEVRSIGSALRLLGRNHLRRWLQVLLYTNESSGQAGHNPLLLMAATRGRLMELLALKMEDKHLAENGFVTGMLSLMDTLLAMPMSEIAASLPLQDAVAVALLNGEGKLGKLLALTLNLERDDPNALMSCVKECPTLTLQDISFAQAEALKWANGIGN